MSTPQDVANSAREGDLARVPTSGRVQVRVFFLHTVSLSNAEPPLPSRYLRALAAFYIRMTFRPVDVYEILEPLLKDYRKIRYRGMGT